MVNSIMNFLSAKENNFYKIVIKEKYKVKINLK